MTESMQSIDAAGFKQAMRRFVSGVTVVTTVNEGARVGITVSAFSSLSLDPPLVLVCVDKGASAHDEIASAKKFAVNILAETQEDISNRFASRDEGKFDATKWHEGPLGLPIIDGSLAGVECELYDSLPGGDHTIFVGRVVSADVADGPALLYGMGGYQKLKS